MHTNYLTAIQTVKHNLSDNHISKLCAQHLLPLNNSDLIRLQYWFQCVLITKTLRTKKQHHTHYLEMLICGENVVKTKVLSPS